MKRIIILPLFLLFIAVSVSAQKTQLKGVVVDAVSKESIPFATIAIYNEIKLIDGVSADENGNFQLNTNKAFIYLEVRSFDISLWLTNILNEFTIRSVHPTMFQ